MMTQKIADDIKKILEPKLINPEIFFEHVLPVKALIWGNMITLEKMVHCWNIAQTDNPEDIDSNIDLFYENMKREKAKIKAQ